MAAIERSATGTWQGNLREGKGHIDAPSGVLDDTPFSFATRFENARGTNPEELIAAAHAACFSMAFSNYLSQKGHPPQEIRTQATIVLEDGRLHTMRLQTTGRVPGLDAAQFEQLAQEAEQRCPVSNLLRPGLQIHLTARLDA